MGKGGILETVFCVGSQFFDLGVKKWEMKEIIIVILGGMVK